MTLIIEQKDWSEVADKLLEYIDGDVALPDDVFKAGILRILQESHQVTAEKLQLSSKLGEEISSNIVDLDDYRPNPGYQHWRDCGFSHEVAAASNAICDEIDVVKERINKLSRKLKKLKKRKRH